jgi:hypothetical protein
LARIAANFLGRHARAGEHPLTLHMGRRRHHEHRIATRRASGFEEERDVEDREGGARRPGPLQKSLLLGSHEGVDDGFEGPHALRLADHQGSELRPVDLTIGDRAREGGFDERCRGSAIERMHAGVRVVHRHAEPAKDRCGCGFAHADGAREAEHEGHRRPSISATMRARSSGVTCGVTPNQRAKPGTGLMKQHAETVDRAKPPGFRKGQQRGLQRHVDDVGDDAPIRHGGEVRLEGRLAGHAEGRGVHQQFHIVQGRFNRRPGERNEARSRPDRKFRRDLLGLLDRPVGDQNALDGSRHQPRDDAARRAAGPGHEHRSHIPLPARSQASGRDGP